MKRFLRRLVPSPRTVRGKLGIVAFLTTFIVLAGSTAGYAYWQSNLSVTSTVGAANLSLATTNFTSVGYTFGNDTLVTTGSVTATNNTVTTSTQSGSVSLVFGPNGASTLAGKVTLNLWSTSSAANCTAAATVPGTATTVLWSAGTTVTTSLAANASASYCLRSSIASRETVATPGGTLTFSPKITGTITLGTFTGSATATTTQSTQYIYPSVTPDTTHWNWIRPNFTNATYDYCLDVSGAATTSGTIVISYGCKTVGASNQNWKFTASGNSGYFTIQPRNSTGLRVDNSSSTASGAGISVITAAGAPATATNQQWQLQQVSAGVYEFVNALSGLCLTSPNGASQNLGQLTQTACNGSQLQQYLISQAFENFTCAVGGNNFTWSWTTATTGPYQVIVNHGGTDTVVTTTAASASGASVSYATIAAYGVGTYNVTFVDANGTTVGLGTVKATSNSTNSCTANDLQ
ncbi:MAG: RICIN domain-containing protein [Actinomycetota bacterium]|nr:RICIN domain-containing protein [Actinomycetota bacterium]